MYRTFSLNDDALQAIIQKLYNQLENHSGVLQLITDTIFKQLFLKSISSENLKIFIEETFWASLLTEERRFHSFVVSLNPNWDIDISRNHRFVFPNPIPFKSASIAKLATAIDGTNSNIGVWTNQEGKLEIWGLNSFTFTNFVVRSIEPGQLIITGSDSLKISISTSEIGFIEQRFNFDNIFPKNRSKRLMQVANLMRSHLHGGTLLIVPNNSKWKKSIDLSDTSLNSPNQSLKHYTDDLDDLRHESSAKRYLRIIGERSLNLLSRLTAIDGATIVSSDLEIIAFGAKIKAKSKNKLNGIVISQPFESSEDKEIALTSLGGTRHQSAAQFVFDQKETAIAIVASQDGKVSVMHWDREIERVRIIQHAEYLFV